MNIRTDIREYEYEYEDSLHTGGVGGVKTNAFLLFMVERISSCKFLATII